MTEDIWDIIPPYSDDDTSKSAAESLPETRLGKLRRAVLDCIRTSDGRTDEEMQTMLGLEANTQRPRRWELVNFGLVEDSGMRRKTVAGRNAVVWVMRPKENGTT